jgi:nitrogen fixation protein FixH
MTTADGSRAPFPRWLLLPFLGLGLVVIANTTLIFAARRAHIRQVEDHPYLAAQRTDQDEAARLAFTNRGWRLIATASADAARLSLTGGDGTPLQSGMLHLYRPDDPADDRQLAWPDPTQTAVIPLPRRGLWRIRIALTAADQSVLSAECALDRP